MKLSHIVSAFFAVTGTLLMVAALCLCLFFQGAEPQITQLPQGAKDCCTALTDALNQGDFQNAKNLIWGQPELGLSQTDADAASLVWDAYLKSITCTPEGEPYTEGIEFYQNVTLTTLDIPSVTKALPGHAQAIWANKLNTAENPAALYTESGDILPQVLSSTLQDALTAALDQGQTLTTQGRIRLIEEDGRWWAIPDSGLTKALSGGLS